MKHNDKRNLNLYIILAVIGVIFIMGWPRLAEAMPLTAVSIR
jgi:hypothetical protein